MKDRILQGYQWYRQIKRPEEGAAVCDTRDIFQGRLDTMYRSLISAGRGKQESALLTAVVGEIGNNCFDHNLGQWNDVAGCWFDHGVQDQPIWVLITDRGQGVFSSLRRVQPALKTEQEAVELAFHKRISGRSPEQRGNGLKFVRSVINENASRGLYFASGQGIISFGGLEKEARQLVECPSERTQGKGTFALILWKAG